MSDEGRALPRIAVPDEGERATVALALVQYWGHLSSSCVQNKGNLWDAVQEGKVVMGLLDDLCEETRREMQALADEMMDQEIRSIIDGQNGPEV